MRVKIIISTLLLTGCMVGPKYEEPCVEFSEEFTESEEMPGKIVDLKEWWMQFEDPILEGMIDEAIANNYDLRIASERIAEVRARYKFASAELWPQINLDATVSREKISEELFLSPFEGPRIQNLFLFGFDAIWELDFFGKLRRLKEAGYFELEASQEDLRDVYITLLAEVARTYANLRAFQERIEITSDQIWVAEELLSLSKARYTAGLRSEIEPAEVSAELNTLRASLPPLENELNQSVYDLAVLLGRQPEDIPQEWLERGSIPKAMGKIPIGMPSDLLRRRPDIRKQERLLAAANSKVGASIALLFPTFSLTGSFGYNSDNTANWFSENAQKWFIAPNVFWPLIDFGRIRSEIDFNNAAHREALWSYEKTVIDALKEVENSLSAYFTEAKRLLELEFRIEDLARSRDLAKIKYEAGLDSLSGYLNAEQRLLLAEQSYISSESTLSENLMTVYKSLGGEWSCCTTP